MMCSFSLLTHQNRKGPIREKVFFEKGRNFQAEHSYQAASLIVIKLLNSH